MTRVLIVDDKPENRYLLRALLQGHGCEVDEARHGAEALVKARQALPDLIISDLLMSVMDGYTLMRQWKADERLKQIPFVVYTATYTEPKDEKLALDLGADAFIVKPAEPEPFMARIEEVLAKAKRDELSPTQTPKGEEKVLLKEYSEILIRKMEEKMLQLEQANRELAAGITERERAEEVLHLAHERLRRFVDANIIGVVIAGADGRIIEANDYYLRLIGFTREELEQGKVDWRVITPPEWLPADEQGIRELRERGTCTPYEKEYVSRDGTRVRVFLVDALLPGPEEQIAAFVLDLTKRKQAEEALEKSRQQSLLLANIIEHASQPFCIGYPDGRLKLLNDAYAKLVGYSKEELLAMTWDRDLTPDEWRESERATLAGLHSTGRPVRYEKEYLRKDGSRVPVELLVHVVRDKDKQEQYYHAFITDMTERKQAEETMRALSLQLSRAEEDERRRIARELHDSTGQKLVALSMTVGLLQDATSAPAGESEKMFADCLAMIEQCAQEIRTLSYLLHPPLLDELGLAAAISDYVEGFSKRSGVRVALDTPPDFERLPDEVEIALFRIVQESLGNIHRHAGTSTARIRLVCDAEQVTLEVSDQGRGMSTEMICGIEAGRGAAGVGIAGMRERLRLLGGRLKIESGGQGTTVRAIVPQRQEPT